MAPGYHRSSHLAKWFPRVGRIDSDRFPEPAALAHRMRLLGGVPHEQVGRHSIERTAGDWCAAVEAGFVSTLHLLEPEEIEAGLAAFREQHPDPDEIINYQLEFHAVWTTRASVES